MRPERPWPEANRLDGRVAIALVWPVARLDRDVLRVVSRSFYLSLRLLPGPMRDATATGYLLARASDTLADSHAVPVERRTALLDAFAEEIEGGGDAWRKGRELEEFRQLQTHPGERVLLGELEGCLEMLAGLKAGEAAAVRRVLRTILGGQKLD